MERAQRLARLRTLEERLETPLAVLGLVWLGLFVAELITGLGRPLQVAITGIWVVFIFDFVFRLWLAPAPFAFLRRNWLTALSLAVPALRMFRALRAAALLRGARGVRVVRVAGSLNRALRALANAFGRRGFGYLVSATGVVVLLAGAAILAFEGGAPGFEDYGTTLWWAAMMVVTVGSEAWPASFEGRLLAFLLALYGFSVLGYVAATLTSFFLDRDAESHAAQIAGARDIRALENEVRALRQELEAARAVAGSRTDARD